MDPRVRRKRLSFLAWFRAGLGAIAGLISGILGLLSLNPPSVNVNAYNGILVAMIVYIASFYIVKYVFKMQLPDADKNKLATQGIFGYIMLFLFVWFLYNTLCLTPGFPCIYIHF
jgi:membrane protein insertase Oxa1/YidC/SpoIIIJ